MRIAPRHIFAISLLTAIAALTIVTPREARAFEYLANGGFESGTAGWTVSPGSDLDVVDAAVLAAHAGEHSARVTLGVGSNSFALRQSSGAGAGAGNYHFSAWIRTTSPSTEVYAELRDAAATQATTISAPVSSDFWIELAGNVPLTASSTLLVAIRGTGAPGDIVYVDDVRLEGAPPVTSIPSPSPTGEAEATNTPDATATSLITATAEATDIPEAEPQVETIGPNLRNGSFESVTDDGTPESWRKYGGTLSASGPARSGAHAARLQSDTEATKWLYQTVTVSAGEWYAFDAWVLHDDANVRVSSLRISWYASADGSGSALDSADSTDALAAPSAEYRFLSTGPVMAPVDAHSARLRVLLAPTSAATGSILVDDATFGRAEPPPVAEIAALTSPEVVEPPGANLVLGEAASPGGPVDAPTRSTTGARTSRGSLLISEVMYDPLGTDDAEWVELYNNSSEPIVLNGWTLADATGGEALRSGRIEPAQFLLVAANSDAFHNAFPEFEGPIVALSGRFGNGLGNAGDRLSLRDPSGAVVDAISWGTDTGFLDPAIHAVPAGHSIERRSIAVDTDSAADWVDNMHPTPGSAFVAASAGAGGDHPQRVAQTLASSDRSLAWLTWWILGASALVLLGALSWRGAPLLSQRLRRQA